MAYNDQAHLVGHMDTFQLDPTFVPLYEGSHLSIGAVSGSTGSQMHKHKGLQVSVLSGHGSLHVEWLTGTGRKCKARFTGPSVCITPAEQLHAMQWSDTMRSLLVGIEPELIEDGGLECIQEGYGLCDPFITALAALVGDVHCSEAPLSRLQAEAAAVILVQHLRRVSGKAPSEASKRSLAIPSRHLARVLEYMDQNLDENLSLAKLARVAGMSVSHFGRAFKMTLGVTPHCYLLQQRVAKAKKLLVAGQLSIAQIALESGFAGQAHFTTAFRKLTGSTPKTYSASVRNAFPRL